MIWSHDQDSQLLQFYRTLICARNERRSLRHGRRRPLVLDGGLYAYTCEDGDEATIVAINSSGRARRVYLPDVAGVDLFSGMAIKGGCTLAPWQAILVEL
jgi:hypothetical protein